MKIISEIKPSPIEFTNNGETIFNYNIVQTGNQYEYSSLLCPGEPTRENILYALIGTVYTQEEICEFENIKESSYDTHDKEAIDTYMSTVAEFDNIIIYALGEDFKACKKEDTSYSERLKKAKLSKLQEINVYDISENVNGFYYNSQFMWLDKETRACLKNTIESLKIVGRQTLNIWYSNSDIELSIDQAEYLLALLEVYATDCYNVTAIHIKDVMNMDNIEDVNSFDVSVGYPSMLHFDE